VARTRAELNEEATMTTSTRWMVAAGLLALAGCSTSTTGQGSMAGTHRMTSRDMCTEAGGTYSTAGCQPATAMMTSRQLCQARGGTYFEGGDYCEVPAQGLRR
jgi:hypothetical protein